MSGSRSGRSGLRSTLFVTLVAATTCVLVTGCNPAPAGTSAAGSSDGAGVPSAPSASSSAGSSVSAAPTVDPSTAATTNAEDGVKGPITVTASDGALSSVTLTSELVGQVQGTLSADARSWTSEAVAPGQSYTLTATAGGRTILTRTFTTAAPARTLTADVSPWGGQTVGVGQPIVVNLSKPVKDKAFRAAVEKALVVQTSQDVGPASWAWISDTRLDYRPKEFWPSGTKVTVHVNLAGVQAGSDLWGTKSRDVDFSIGRAFVMKIDNASHTMTVTQDGAVLRRVPVSMGRAGYETRSGIKTIMSHEKKVRMSSESYGGADFYDEIVEYAQRLTWSGEYIHSAPWSVYAQGRSNVSHGCVNVSPANAIWLFGQTLVGDPVITVGTSRQMEPGNGDGGDWQYSWSQWTAKSALAA